jgi:hypothetical protein
MTKEIENLIKKIALRDVELKMLEKIEEGLIISKDVILEILKELETNLK